MTICNNTMSFRPVRLLATGLLLLVCTLAYSQTIIIGGDIYGGGREGAVGTAKTQNATISKDSVVLKDGALTGNTTNITIYTGTVRTVFGGGQNGRTFGNTNVTVKGTTTSTVIGSPDWEGSIYGGVFGAGDGKKAYVFGHSHLNIIGGTINQNVYGGGNQADLMGSTTVVLQGGTLNGALFGGARLANIFGYSFVNIDGQNAKNNLKVKAVYGGNDIAGNISSSSDWTWTSASSLTLPSVLEYAKTNVDKYKNYNAFVFASPEKSGTKIFIGQVYGGGNGDYDYRYSGNAQTGYTIDSTLWKTRTGSPGSYTYTYESFPVTKRPEVEKVYLELNGGTYGYVYGGGNDATVTGEIDICLNNRTARENIFPMDMQELDNMGLNYDSQDTVYIVNGQTLTSKYQFDRVFGGNNKATMDRQPSWHITKAIINNLYSGGNAGNMTNSTGLLLSLTSPDLEVNNVYGGCRRADVDPDLTNDNDGKIDRMIGRTVGILGDTISYDFPEDLSAHILITAGKIKNVYGGNDISGKVKGGNGLDIRSSITGDVYGGGNGSYKYTDNSDLSTHRIYKDFYYEIDTTLTGSDAIKSAKALNEFRPNAEQAWISISGKQNNPTVVGGSLYCGGNSATLDIDPSQAASKHATLKIGSYIIAQNVFLGSNGKNMIDNDMLDMYDHGAVDNKTFSKIDFDETDVFAEYIKGVSVGIRPQVTFDDNYADSTAFIGSLFFGGNLGSVTAGGTFDVTFAKNLVIFDKIVAGCNDANYYSSEHGNNYGIEYEGGITTKPDTVGKPKINMTLNKITLKPGKIAYDANNKPYVAFNVNNGRLVGGNIFGGCYSSGIINGDVVITLSSAAYNDAKIFGSGNSGVTRKDQLDDVFSTALSIFGGGFGEHASIEGNTTINISGTGRMLKVFGGGLKGPVNQSTTINLNGGEVGKIYGGGFEGRIEGNTTVNLYGGTVYNAFGGACNANIGGYAQVYVGKANTQSITTVQNNVYGGNDFGGRIEGTGNFAGKVSGIRSMVHSDSVLTSSTYVEYVQGSIAGNIFGGACGAYDYTVSPYKDSIITDNGNPNNPLPYLVSSFVNFKGNNHNLNTVKQVFGAGQGKEGSDAADNIQDKMQQRTYVLVNSTADSTFNKTDIFGAGAYSGVGMDIAQSNRDSSALENHSTIVDLVSGWINNAYGASYNEGFTRRTVVNVPTGSTAKMANLFGGGYGSKLTSPCDAYESHVNWNSGTASCGYLYGGNNNSRRVLYTFVNINEQAWSDKNSGFLTTVYGAGCGPDTWAEYTYVNLNDKALVYEVYGGGYGGKVLNLESVNAWKAQDGTLYTVIGSGYTDLGFKDTLTAVNGLGFKTNTNVFINKGAVVGLQSDRRSDGIYPVVIKGGYGYAGGYGDDNLKNGFDESIGSVCGTTYIGLHGGIVWKDMYAGGTLGSVYDGFKTKAFTAQSNAYVEGGSTRNVYGAGWKGRIGYTELPVNVDLNTTNPYEVLENDIPGESNVVIGIKPEYKDAINLLALTDGEEPWGFYKGLPTVERNAYSSGEDGGAVIGTAHMTVYGGYVGYRYAALNKPENLVNHYFSPAADDSTYIEYTYDETWTFDAQHPNPEDGKDRLLDAGSVFGGGYTDNATADNTIVTVWGGHIRNSVYGGGEVAAIGRGEANEAVGSAIRTLKGIYKSGTTQVNIYSGNIDRNVFGGGKGYNNNGNKGSLLTDGYVFGSTEVNIYGGEIGTDLTVLEGDGNVFGGGNIGYVFNSLASKKDSVDGYYYKINSAGNFITDNNEQQLSEDCKVVVTPYSKVLSQSVTVKDPDSGKDTTFAQFSFVPTKYLNQIKKTDPRWYNEYKDSGDLDQTGIIIHNAIFAGGNVSSGNELYANTKTVFGNATATVNDLYYIDLITVGTEHIGGLYGDGNLTRVDGYRELNITNYGTDYYGMNTTKVSLDDYHKMNDRERAYFQLKYQLKKGKTFTWNGKEYKAEKTVLTKDEIQEDLKGAYELINNVEHSIVSAAGVPDTAYWDEYGFVSIYAGRLINTIQRADFVGVFGSRMVMQGARDRVPETVDFTDYTINRVGEVSLNRVKNPINEADSVGVKENGNYFGIYNIVNHLEALTSDVDLYNEKRITAKTNDSHYLPDETTDSIKTAQSTYFGWKQANKLNRRRNDGEAANKVALASGVYLEITKEESTADSTIWGPITGVLELDLINVMPGLGGGYVYAMNEHGDRKPTGLKHITLSSYNRNAVSNKMFRYEETGIDDDIQTSGNLVSDKTIIDDCYPISDSYTGTGHAAGHYWYIKGEIYLYDMYLSAYTGAAEAYSKTVSIPLTITAGSHGVIKLDDVKPNKYLYYNSDLTKPLNSKDAVLINNITYHLNDSISYWDWLQLSASDQKMFVDTTYVAIADFSIGNNVYAKDTVLDRKKYDALVTLSHDSVHHIAKNKNVAITEVLRMSNDMSHSKGYALTLAMNNPEVWNTYYTKPDTLIKTTTPNNSYLKAPTYRVLKAGIYGRREYGKGDIITEDVYTTYQNLKKKHTDLDLSDSAHFERAYVMSEDWSIQNDISVRYFNKGLVLPKSDWSTNGIGNKAAPALFCTDTWKLQNPDLLDEYVFYGTCITEAEIRELGATYGLTTAQIDNAIETYFSPAYICTEKGKYGGDYYEKGTNHLTKVAWSAMNPEDRKNFEFNYDAFDILIDSAFSGKTLLYDGKNQTQSGIYSSAQPIDYSAKFMPNDSIRYYDKNGQLSAYIKHNDILNRAQYESLPNEQYHYAPFMIDKIDSTYYIVETEFTVGKTSYSKGNVISPAAYADLDNDTKENILVLAGSVFQNEGTGKYYYCRDSYEVGINGTEDNAQINSEVTDVFSHTTYSNEDIVPLGCIITESDYNKLPNIQKYFSIHGKTPVGVSTLYVSGQSNILDLSKGRIFTVVYLYEYEESDEEGNNINQVSEKHVVNIHVDFQGGTPTIEQLNNPPTILPGSTLGIKQPRVTPGAYEVIGGGWELFASQQDADNHMNGSDFENGGTQLYWYNHDYYLAYYAKTYLGKTYSNAVPIKVGNYHDLSLVMRDSLHHMYVDHPNVKHNSKVYITNNKFDADTTRNELDMLKDFYDLSLYTLTINSTTNDPDTIKDDNSQFKGSIPMNAHVRGGNNIDFILKSDIAPLAYKTSWTPIGDNTQCFEGKIHGDGHTISGLTNSLFGNLCDSVYNLGVTGSFTSAGIANTGGYAENCWVMTSSTDTTTLRAIKAVLATGTVVNSYYPDVNTYSKASAAKARPLTAFHNGEVAYDLNGFYLAKRYAIETNAANNNKYYYTIKDSKNNLIALTDSAGYVKATDYVAKRYIDGDFIYASGKIPDQTSERMFFKEPKENETADIKNNLFFPIYPDDYIFFGQMLTYGYSTIRGEEYQEYPSSINRDNRNAVGTSTNHATQWIAREEINSSNSIKSNRVYRAPAYFGNSTMSAAHFNANAFLPAKTSNGQTDVYPGMTALDLTGYGDNSWTNGWTQDGKFFMTKVLDYNALTGFRSDGQTRNLLAYAAYEDSITGNRILARYFADQDFEYTIDVAHKSVYKAVAVMDSALAARVKGHLVYKMYDGTYQADTSQYLVDRQDFNAPISYSFGQGTYMWYQRTPQHYVESNDAGWEAISLPFTAEYVTTQDKGELTHFYNGSNTGHEYWLREYSKIENQTQNQTTTVKAMFSAPAASDDEYDKVYGNTFLWDYYYKKNSGNDANADKYFQTYYSESHTFEDYPLYVAGTPYLIGFPGERYYEFDLSGNFLASNTAGQPDGLDPQVITFISPDAGTTIGVTDLEYAANSANHDNYVYTPNYKTQTVNAYMLNNAGDSFVYTEGAQTVPFRAYLTSAPTGLTQRRAGTRADAIFIGYLGDTDPLVEIPVQRGLNIYGEHMTIVIENTMTEPAIVTINTVAGRLLKQFIIQPGTKATVPVNNRGIYIVNRQKVAVTR